MKKLILILAVGVSAAMMYSCEKNEFKPESGNKKEVEVKTKRSSSCATFTEAQIAQIGVDHNAYLSEAFTNFNYQAADLEVELKQQFENISLTGITAAQKTTIINTTLTWNDVKDDFINQTKVKQYMDDVEAVLLNVNNNLAQITTQLATIESNASSDLTCQDLEAIKIMISVGKNSAEFWLPAAQGGTGEGDDILIDIGVGPQYISDYARKVIAADAAGAGFAFITWGFSAFLGPVGWAGLAYAVGTSTAISSGLAAIGFNG